MRQDETYTRPLMGVFKIPVLCCPSNYSSSIFGNGRFQPLANRRRYGANANAIDNPAQGADSKPIELAAEHKQPLCQSGCDVDSLAA